MSSTSDAGVQDAGHGRGLRRFIASLTAVMVLVVVFFGGLTYVFLQDHLATVSREEQVHRVRVIREVLEQRLAFYHDLLQGYARDPVVRDLVAFGNAADAVGWSARVRDTLPQSIGAALFTADGEVLGEATSQRVGKQCVLDLQRRVRGESHTLLPLHDDIPALAHFDVTTPVRDETGEALGLIFVSFTVKELLVVLDRVSTDREAAALVDKASGSIVATSPNWKQLADNPEVSVGVAGSDWQLRIRLAPSSLVPALPVVGGLILSGVLAVILLMVLSGRYLTRRYFTEVEDIQAMLGRILAGEQLSDAEVRRAGHFFPRSGELRDALAQLGSQHHSLHRDIHLDELTGLANRRAFDQRLEELLGRGRRQSDGDGFCVVLFDLDGLKAVNDRHGHVAGDQALRAFGRAMQRSVRGSDLASRWGGDEFAVLLPHMTTEQLEAWLERMRTAFDEEQDALGTLEDSARCRVSAGHVYVAPGDGRRAQALIREADQRLYKDKATRRGLHAVP